MRVGFVGLGSMGRPIAGHLATEGNLVVYDIDAAKTKALEAIGASVAPDPRSLGDTTDVVFCSLPRAEHVRAAILGEGGVASGSRARVIVDLSTIGPAAAADIAASVSGRGKVMLDAPVSGGSLGAAAGALTLMVAGQRDAYDEVEPLLRAFGQRLFYIGAAPGQAQQMKLVNNMIGAACAVASFEALILGAKAGLPAQTMLDVINVSSGQNFMTSHKVGNSILNRSFPPGFATGLMLKDLNLGLDLAAQLGVPMGVIGRVREFVQFAATQGDPEADYAGMIRHLELWSKVELRV